MTVIENIRTKERWVIDDNIPIPANEFKIIGNLDDLLKEEKIKTKQREIKEYVDKCLLQKKFCDNIFLYDFT